MNYAGTQSGKGWIGVSSHLMCRIEIDEGIIGSLMWGEGVLFSLTTETWSYHRSATGEIISKDLGT